MLISYVYHMYITLMSNENRLMPHTVVINKKKII